MGPVRVAFRSRVGALHARVLVFHLEAVVAKVGSRHSPPHRFTPSGAHMNTIESQASELDRLARRRVSARLGWLTHGLVYLAVMGSLTAVALWQGRQPPVAAALGWGLGLTIHGLRVLLSSAGAGLRERMVQAERQRLVDSNRK